MAASVPAMRLRLVAPLILLLSTLPLPGAAAEDDAGSGRDAPDARGLAMEVSVGTISGALPYGDQDDWYRIAVPEGHALVAAYVSSSPYSYHDLYLYEASTEAWLTVLESGDRAALQPADGVAQLRVAGSYYGSGITYEITLSFEPAAPQDDDGSGMDAGNHWNKALATNRSVLRGTIDGPAGDFADWFRFQAAPGEFVRLDIREGYPEVEVRDVDGRLLASLYYYGGSVVVPDDGVLLLGLKVRYYHSIYAVDVERVVRADLGVAQVVVHKRPIETDPGVPAPDGPNRDVEIRIDNSGAGDSSNARLLVYTEPVGFGKRRVLADVAVSVPAGGSLVKTIPWNTYGQIGDFTLGVEVTTDHDLGLTDNKVTRRTYHVVGGLGYGIDLLSPPLP